MEQKNNAVLPLVDYAVKAHIPVELFATQQISWLKMDTQTLLAILGTPSNGSGTLEFAKEIMQLLKAKPENIIQKWYDLNKMGLYCD